MSLSNEDRVWLDQKFGKVWGAIVALKLHDAKTCKDVIAHEEKHHNPSAFWGRWASIVTVATTAATLAAWIIKHL